MLRSAFLLPLLSIGLRAALPQDALMISSLATGPSGEIYAAGKTVNNTGFISRLPDGFVYQTDSPVSALAICSDGSILASGVSFAISGYPQTGLRPFLIKLDPNGKLKSSRLLDAFVADIRRIAVNASGESVISGGLFSPMLAGTFSTTAGAVTLAGISTFGHLIKVDASGQISWPLSSAMAEGPSRSIPRETFTWPRP